MGGAVSSEGRWRVEDLGAPKRRFMVWLEGEKAELGKQ